MPDDSAKAFRGKRQPTGQPAGGLIGALSPAAYFADVSAYVLEQVLDAVRRQQCHFAV